jgi:hypothetical protein
MLGMWDHVASSGMLSFCRYGSVASDLLLEALSFCRKWLPVVLWQRCIVHPEDLFRLSGMYHLPVQQPATVLLGATVKER